MNTQMFKPQFYIVLAIGLVIALSGYILMQPGASQANVNAPSIEVQEVAGNVDVISAGIQSEPAGQVLFGPGTMPYLYASHYGNGWLEKREAGAKAEVLDLAFCRPGTMFYFYAHRYRKDRLAEPLAEAGRETIDQPLFGPGTMPQLYAHRYGAGWLKTQEAIAQVVQQ